MKSNKQTTFGHKITVFWYKLFLLHVESSFSSVSLWISMNISFCLSQIKVISKPFHLLWSTLFIFWAKSLGGAFYVHFCLLFRFIPIHKIFSQPCVLELSVTSMMMKTPLAVSCWERQCLLRAFSIFRLWNTIQLLPSFLFVAISQLFSQASQLSTLSLL